MKWSSWSIAVAGETQPKGRLRIAWHYKAMARGAGATLLPGDALSRRLKLVAAPARSKSEPDPGGHASHAT
jgi:hypothetical protein